MSDTDEPFSSTRAFVMLGCAHVGGQGTSPSVGGSEESGGLGNRQVTSFLLSVLRREKGCLVSSVCCG